MTGGKAVRGAVEVASEAGIERLRGRQVSRPKAAAAASATAVAAGVVVYRFLRSSPSEEEGSAPKDEREAESG